MSIELDHTIVPSHRKVVSAKLLAELLGVPWAESALGYFSPVCVRNEPDGHQWEMLTVSYARQPA